LGIGIIIPLAAGAAEECCTPFRTPFLDLAEGVPATIPCALAHRIQWG